MIGINPTNFNNLSNMLNYMTKLGSNGRANCPSKYDYTSKNAKKLHEIFKNKTENYNKYNEQVDSFNKTSTAFYKGLYSAMGDLKTSSSPLKTYTADSVTSPIGGAADAQVILENVQQFTADFNNAVDFLSKNSSLSAGVKNLSANISDITKFRGGALSSIGISVDSMGKLAVDSEAFKAAFISDDTKVKSLLGDFGGIAERANSTAAATIITSQNLLKPPTPPTSNSYSTYFYNTNKTSFLKQNQSTPSGLLMDKFI